MDLKSKKLFLFLLALAILMLGVSLPTEPSAYAETNNPKLQNSKTRKSRLKKIKRNRTKSQRSKKKRASNESLLNVDPQTLLSRVYHGRAQETLKRYLPLNEFQVNVTVIPSGKPLPIMPYDPTGVVLSRSAKELSPYIGRITIDVLLTTRLKASRQRIRQLMTRELNLSSKRGDKVQFGSLGIELEPEIWRQEKLDLKADLSRLKSENDKLSRDLSRSQTQEGFLGKNTKWAIVAAVGAVFLLILLGLFLAGRSVVVLGKNLGGSVTAIASAMETVGTSIQAAAGISPENSSLPGTLEAKMITEGGGKGNALASLPMESLHAHFLKLRQELLENINEGTEAVILKHLTLLLSDPASVGRAVVTMELLGRDMATELFKRLGVSSQEALLRFMREGRYGSSKVELMLEAGEELKTKLLVDSFDMARGRPSEKVAEKVLQLSEEDLVIVSMELSPELMPRLFLYMDASKIALILAALKKENVKAYSKTLSILSKMPDAETANHYDQDILKTLEAIIARTRSDAQRPFLKIYQEIIEAAEDELSEDIVEQLSSDPRLDEYFRENVITIHTFFKLTEEARNEIIESLSNKDIAGFAYGVSDDEKKVIMQSLPPRRKGLIAEEYESLSSRGGRQAKYAFKRVRDSLVKKLREMKAQGMLAAALVKTKEKPKARKKNPAALGGPTDQNTGGAQKENKTGTKGLKPKGLQPLESDATNPGPTKKTPGPKKVA